jgi:hypothetical protein
MSAPAVYAAIAACTKALSRTGIEKSRQNTQQGFAFRGIDDVYNALSGVLAQHQLCIIPRVVRREVTERQTQRGGVLFYVVVEVEFDLVCAVDGSTHMARFCGEAMDSGDKATNKAMSAAYKYMALQLFCIPTEADNDADASHHDVAPQDNGPTEAGKAVLEAIAAADTQAAVQAIKPRIMALSGADRQAAIAAGTARMAALRQPEAAE